MWIEIIEQLIVLIYISTGGLNIFFYKKYVILHNHIPPIISFQYPRIYSFLNILKVNTYSFYYTVPRTTYRAISIVG